MNISQISVIILAGSCNCLSWINCWFQLPEEGLRPLLHCSLERFPVQFQTLMNFLVALSKGGIKSAQQVRSISACSRGCRKFWIYRGCRLTWLLVKFQMVCVSSSSWHHHDIIMTSSYLFNVHDIAHKHETSIWNGTRVYRALDFSGRLLGSLGSWVHLIQNMRLKNENLFQALE